MNLRLGSYRLLQRKVVAPWASPSFRTGEREKTAWSEIGERVSHAGQGRIWFHAASMELESLWPVAMEWARRGGECVLTVFSSSARGHLEKLRLAVEKERGRVIYCGYSPFEGEWFDAFRQLKPDVFVTAKYEAWPDLWASAAELRLPIVTVGAQARRSLRVAKTICHLLGAEVPRHFFLPVAPEEAREIERLFPGARVDVTGEPRWDRVFERAIRGNPRVTELLSGARELPRPWGILGSVWPEDLKIWESLWGEIPGTLFVVPHRVENDIANEIKRSLESSGKKVARTSETGQLREGQVILVDEMGFLSELYAHADWAYVGGGFGRGVHSTIEPAIHGIPVSAGPGGGEKFSEISELSRTGQLTLVREEGELRSWLTLVMDSEWRARGKARWLAEAVARRGAAARVVAILEEIVNGSRK